MRLIDVIADSGQSSIGDIPGTVQREPRQILMPVRRGWMIQGQLGMAA